MTRNTDWRLTQAMTRHQSRILDVLKRSGVTSSDADDVLQESLLVLAGRLDQVPERAERAFLVNTALRMAADRRRTVWGSRMDFHDDVEVWSHQMGSSNEWAQHSDLDPEELAKKQQAKLYLDAALASLPEDERSVFLLVEFESMSRQEVAHLLGLPNGTVASRLARSRVRFESVTGELLRRAESLSLLVPAASHAPETPTSLVDGPRHFFTNAWGCEKTCGRREQRLLQRRVGGELQRGWYWYWSGLDDSVFAYPEVMTGWKPWNGGKPTDERLPIHLSKAKGLVVDYAAEVRATGRYNLALSTWLTACNWSHAANAAAITTEVMVWPNYSPGARPPGVFLETLHADGETYELWRALGYGKRYKRDNWGWTVLTLRGVGGRLRGKLALGELLADLAARRLVDPDQFVTCVELGNEIMGGAGTTFIEQFAVHV